MKILHITIGIPAHNESANIGKLLKSIVSQKQSIYTTDKIIIYCDKCTDSTASVIREFQKKHEEIVLIDNKKRTGKTEVMNKLHNLSKSEVFVALDADVVLASNKVIDELVKPFIDYKSVSLVGGNDLPYAGKTQSEKIVVSRINLWLSMCRAKNGGVSVHNHPGRINASRKSLYKHFKFPSGIIADDDYQYFTNKKLGFGFYFSNKAIVRYKAPNSMKDFYLQFSRFIESEKVIESEFGRMAIEEYNLSISDKIFGIVKSFIKNPSQLFLIIVTQLYLNTLLLFSRENKGQKYWETVKSTK